MFKTTKKGLEIYKQKIEGYLRKCSEIDAIKKKERGIDYRGNQDWPKDDLDWKTQTESLMYGMRLALGLFSTKAVDKIWKNIKEKLETSGMST